MDEDVKRANEVLCSLILDHPVEFTMALQRMMAQAAHDVFMGWERYRAALHDKTILGNAMIPVPQRPADTPFTVEIYKAILPVQNAMAVPDEEVVTKVEDLSGRKGGNGRG